MIPHDTLLSLLSAAIPAAGKDERTSRALIRIADGTASVTCTDGEITIRASAVHDGPDLVALPSAQQIHQIAKALPDEPVALLVDPDRYRLELRCAPAEYVLPCRDPDDLQIPDLRGDWSASVGAASLGEALARTVYGVPAADTRYGLNGAHLELEPEILRVVTTDGSRLCLAECQLEGTLQIPPRSLLSRRAMSVLARLCGGAPEARVHLCTGERELLVTISAGGVEVTVHARMIEGEFPDYRSVMPTSHTHRAVLDRTRLLHAVRRVALGVGDTAATIRWVQDSGEVALSASSVERGSADHPVPAEVEGDRIETGFRASYLIDLLSPLAADTVSVETSGVLAPWVWREGAGEDLWITMPIRLD